MGTSGIIRATCCSRALNTPDLRDSSLIPSGHHPGLVRYTLVYCPMIAVITERSDDDDVGPPPARGR